MIRVELAQDSIQNGDGVRGHAEWNSSGKDPRKIEVVCRWRVDGEGRDREEIVDQKVESSLAGRPQATIPFEFQIPFFGPLSYEGKLFRIVWEIVARADLPMARDEVDTKVFTVRARPYNPEEFPDEDEEEEEGEEEEPATSG